MNKKYQLCGVGNALVDLLVEVDEELFQTFGLEKSGMRLVSAEEQKNLVAKIPDAHIARSSGGSVANSIVSFAELGGRAAFFGAVAKDDFGNFYREEFYSLKIAFPIEPKQNCVTGTSLVLITPDSERTMQTHLGDGLSLTPSMIDEKTVAESDRIFLEGYILANPENRQGGIDRLLKLAKQHNTQIVLTLSEAWVVETCREEVEKVLNVASLVFANEAEARAVAKTDTTDNAISVLEKRGFDFVVTQGENGAYVSVSDAKGMVPAFSVKTVDLTGAGDMYAAAFLYGLSQGIEPLTAGRKASFLASRVISQVGARYKGDLNKLWIEA